MKYFWAKLGNLDKCNLFNFFEEVAVASYVFLFKEPRISIFFTNAKLLWFTYEKNIQNWDRGRRKDRYYIHNHQGLLPSSWLLHWFVVVQQGICDGCDYFRLSLNTVRHAHGILSLTHFPAHGKTSSRGAYVHDPFWSVFKEYPLDFTRSDSTMTLSII